MLVPKKISIITPSGPKCTLKNPFLGGGIKHIVEYVPSVNITENKEKDYIKLAFWCLVSKNQMKQFWACSGLVVRRWWWKSSKIKTMSECQKA